jgi:phospholipase D1/2
VLHKNELKIIISKTFEIFQAYVQMIRNAENFIYIENQYFLGSAYAWLNDFQTNADHTIPAEIAQKVKHYICRPML